MWGYHSDSSLGWSLMFVFFPPCFFLYLFALELYRSVVWSPLGRASISTSYGIFFRDLDVRPLTQFTTMTTFPTPALLSLFSQQPSDFNRRKWGGMLFVVRGTRQFPPLLTKLDFANTANHKRWAMYYQIKIEPFCFQLCELIQLIQILLDF